MTGVYLRMSNQRPGKLQKPLDRNGDMQVYKFFKTASKVLKDAGKEDEAFYFEQMEDYIKSGKDKEMLEWAKQRLKSVNNLLTMNGEVE